MEEKDISHNSKEYQQYLEKLRKFFEDKEAYSDKLMKLKKQGKQISGDMLNIKYYIDSNGDYIKENKNEIQKIMKPKYLDINRELKKLNNQRGEIKANLIKTRDDILNGDSDKQISKNFTHYKSEYLNIHKKIESLELYLENINNTSNREKGILDLEIEIDSYEEELRKMYYKMKLSDNHTKNKELAKIYISNDDDSIYINLKNARQQLSKMKYTMGIQKLDNDYYKLNKNPKELIDYKIVSLPIFENKTGKKKKKSEEGEIQEDKLEVKKKTKKDKNKLTQIKKCSKRNPGPPCEDDYYEKKNKAGDFCCYKKPNNKKVGGGKGILRIKGTKKKDNSIQWDTKDSLGNKLNTSEFKLDNDTNSIDLSKLDLNDFDDKSNDDSINKINSDFNNSPEINTNNLSEININKLSNISTKSNNLLDNIKKISINTNKKTTSYFSELQNDDEEDKNNHSNLNLLNLLDNNETGINKVNNTSNLKNIKINL
jgi:hypothetical protein